MDGWNRNSSTPTIKNLDMKTMNLVKQRVFPTNCFYGSSAIQ